MVCAPAVPDNAMSSDADAAAIMCLSVNVIVLSSRHGRAFSQGGLIIIERFFVPLGDRQVIVTCRSTPSFFHAAHSVKKVGIARD